MDQHRRDTFACPRSPGCIACIANVKRRGNYRGHVAYLPPSKKKPFDPYRWSTPMQRPSAKPAAGPLSWPDESWLKKYPLLVAHIADELWDDGTSREPSTVVIRGQDGLVLAALNDKEGRASLYRSASSVLEAMAALEKALGQASPDWRTWQGGKGKGKGK